MSASPSQILDPGGDAAQADPGHVQFTLTLSLDPDDAAALQQAAAIRCLPIATFMAQAALVEAWRTTDGHACLATPTTSRFVHINEVFDRLAAALGDSERTLLALGDFIQETMHPTYP